MIWIKTRSMLRVFMAIKDHCGKVKLELWIASYELRYTSYEFTSASSEFKYMSCEVEFTNYEFKSSS